jgi:ADP-heptose:LPS heptosyltransferase
VTPAEVFDAIRAAGRPPLDIDAARRLAEEAADDPAATAALFRDLVEPLSDAFDPEFCERYVELFSEVVAALRPEHDAARLRARYRHICQKKNFEGDAAAVERVFVLSRVTLGADVAVTSVLMDASKRAFPQARIAFVGNRKNAELWAADSRVDFLDAPYARAGTLRERLDMAARSLGQLVDHPSSIVIDPDSRLTQLGLIPVCGDERYFYFESRRYGAESRESLGELAGRWAHETFGVGAARAYITSLAAPKISDTPRVAVSFGVGENPAKRVGEAFEAGVLRHLAGRGLKIVVDKGAGGEEAERVERAIAASGAQPGQIETFFGPFAEFAAMIGRGPLYVGYDSAGQHVAAACGVPLVAVFAGYPNERFLHRWRPYGLGRREVVAGSLDPGSVLANATDVIDRLLSELPKD